MQKHLVGTVYSWNRTFLTEQDLQAQLQSWNRLQLESYFLTALQTLCLDLRVGTVYSWNRTKYVEVRV